MYCRVISTSSSIPSAIMAVNRRADAYDLKSFDMLKVLETIKEQLERQEKEEECSKEKVAEFIGNKSWGT